MPMQIPIYRHAFKITRKRRPWDTTESTSKKGEFIYFTVVIANRVAREGFSSEKSAARRLLFGGPSPVWKVNI
jgi:hypothetical protein